MPRSSLEYDEFYSFLFTEMLSTPFQAQLNSLIDTTSGRVIFAIVLVRAIHYIYATN